MNEKRPLLFLLGVLALGGLIPRNLAAQLTPEGPVMRADTSATSVAACPQLAVGPDESFEIVWSYRSNSDFSIFGRHFTASGEPTDPAQIPIGPAGSVRNSIQLDRVGALPNGFQVLFDNTDTSLKHPPVTFRQRFDLTGSPAGPAQAVIAGVPVLIGPAGSPYASYYQPGPKKLLTQPISSDGKPQGKRILVNSRAIDQPALQLAPLGAGDFVAAWTGLTTGKHPRQVIRARLVHNGVGVGQDFDVNATPGGLKGSPPYIGGNFAVVGNSSTRDFAVVWSVVSPQGISLHLRFFDSSGGPRTHEIVAAPSALSVYGFAAALDDAGHLLLLWSPQEAVLRAQLFAAAQDGAPLGAAFQLGPNRRPSCGDLAWAGSSWLIAWYDIGDDGRGEVLWRRLTE